MKFKLVHMAPSDIKQLLPNPLIHEYRFEVENNITKESHHTNRSVNQPFNRIPLLVHPVIDDNAKDFGPEVV